MTARSSDEWHQPLRHVRADELSADTGQTPGMSRREAISAPPWAQSGSGWVRPGSRRGPRPATTTTASPRPRSTSSPGTRCSSSSRTARRCGSTPEPGDFVFVPPYTPHREENPTDEDAVVVLARSTQEAIVVNLPSLE